MCYAIPAQVVEIRQPIGIVDYFGEKRKVLINFLDLEIGDYIYAQGGIAVTKISPPEAREVLNTWKEAFFSLKKIDAEISKVDLSDSLSRYPREPAFNRNKSAAGSLNPSPAVLKILQKINRKEKITFNEFLFLLKIKKREELKLLYNLANNIRQKEISNACCVHGIIEFSNYCKRSCWYCGIRKERRIKRYRMENKEIIDLATHAVKKLGFKALVLQSGEDDDYNQASLLSLVKEIKKLGVLIILSIGEREKSVYQHLFEAGARGVLLRFETSNKNLFQKMRPHSCWNTRLQLIRELKKIGYIVASGFIIGLPGERDEDLLNNILLTHSLKPDMYSFGPFIPARETPLENHRPGIKDKILKAIALTRFLERKGTILITTALETLAREAKREGLLCGGNSLMINITPPKYKKLYAIYNQRAGRGITTVRSIRATIDLLYSLGRAPVDIGHNSP